MTADGSRPPEDAVRQHPHRFLFAHGQRWLCACGKAMDESDVAPTAPKTPDLMNGPALDLAASAPDLAVDAAGTTDPTS